MSPDISSQPAQRRWFEHSLFLWALSSVIVPVILGASSVWYSQGQTVRDIEAAHAKQQATDARVDANKREQGEQLKELRKEMVTKEVLDEKWKTVEKIDRTVDELLRLQLRGRR